MEEPSISISNASEKVDKEGLCLEDRISGLPDDVIVSILSQLPMKEAGRTSVLSKRWRYMWTSIPRLNFDASHILFALNFDYITKILKVDASHTINVEAKKVEVERPLYLSWVNQVLKSYCGSTIDEFQVEFDLDDSCKFDIDRWVDFALQKRVKILDIDTGYGLGSGTNFYNFPDTGHISNYITNSLINFRLSGVNVSGEVLEYLLANSPLLEELSVKSSKNLVNLTVPDVSFKLQRLEIISCSNAESIEICAMNLVSFKYSGPEISLSFKNVKGPAEMLIGGDYCEYLLYNFSGISCCLSRLESLHLDIASFQDDVHSAKFPIFYKLKHLQLIISAIDIESLLVFAPLIEACPFLYKFVLELEWCKAFGKRRRKKVRSAPAHHHLKVVEFIGFVGRTNDVELATYLLKSAISLEKIILDCRRPILIGTAWEVMETKDISKRKRAEKLRTKIPAGADLIII